MNVDPTSEAAHAPMRVDARIEAALTAAQVATWEWDPLTDALRATAAIHALYGLAPGQEVATGLDISRLVHPEDREERRALMEATVRAHGSWRREFRVVRPVDGALVWLEERGQGLRNPKTGRSEMLGVVWDITECKRADEALRGSEEKYRALFTSIDEAFCLQEVVFDDMDHPVDLRYIEVNRAFEKLTGLRAPAGHTARELFLDEQASWLRLQGEVALTGEPVRFETYVAPWDHWLDIHSFRVGDAHERKVASIFTDITDRRRGDEQFRRAAAFDAFRVALNDALRGLDDAAEVEAVAARVLGQRLLASRAFYIEVENEPEGDYFNVRPGYSSPEAIIEPRRYRAGDVGGTLLDELRGGRNVVVPDVEREPRLTQHERRLHFGQQVRAYVGVPLIKSGRLAAILMVEQKRPRSWSGEDIAFIEETAQRTWAAVERARAEQALRRSREELEVRVRERTRELAQMNQSLREQIAQRQRAEQARRDLLRQLVNAQEDERRRISRELHDELGQQMCALTLKLAMLRKAQPKGAVRTELEALEKIALETDNGLDFLVWQLRPTALDDLGLVAALDDYVHDWSSHFGIEAHICANRNEAVRLDPEIETVLYRVVQEALNNVAKYAKAQHVEVKLERGASHVSLDIHDDGVGFDPESIAAAKGLGLVGMRERATLIGGELAISSVPGAGTSIRVHVPLPLAT